MPFVPTSRYLDNIFQSEQSFCQLYPLPIQQLDQLHWSPLSVVYKSVKFLVSKKNAQILDIGSGVGKFCLAGTYYEPSACFWGVEQRQSLVEHAQSAKEKLGRLNVRFLHKDFTKIDLKVFDGFYFYNSFFENIPGSMKIDDNIAYSTELYHYYSLCLQKALDEMPVGTRIVTYCSWGDEIPPSYQLIEMHNGESLKYWEKKI